MNQIGAIIDFEAFFYNGQHLLKEIGIIYTYDEPIFNYKVQLPVRFYDLTMKDKKSAMYCTNYIHGLRFENKPTDITYTECISILKETHENIQWNGFSHIAYKGGIIEHNLLNMLGIPCINLEAYNCPKFTTLLYEYDTPTVQCDAHRFAKPGITVHCPNVEITLFKKWLKDYKF